MSDAASAPARDERAARRSRGSCPTARRTRSGSSAGASGPRSIVDNLLAYRISMLYGASGVGKSSVLHAGVVSGLRARARVEPRRDGTPRARRSCRSRRGAATNRSRRCRRRSATPSRRPLRRSHATPPTGRLADVCVEWGNRIGGPLLVVLDQFEEYFLYHRGDGGPGSLDEELSRRAAPAEHAGQLRALDPRGRARAARPLRGPRPRPPRKPPPDRPPRPGGCARGDRTAARALEPRPRRARRGGRRSSRRSSRPSSTRSRPGSCASTRRVSARRRPTTPARSGSRRPTSSSS